MKLTDIKQRGEEGNSQFLGESRGWVSEYELIRAIILLGEERSCILGNASLVWGSREVIELNRRYHVVLFDFEVSQMKAAE